MKRSGTLYDLDTGNGVQGALRFIEKNEKRQDTAHTYLHLDLEMQNWMYKKQREIVRHTSLSRGELPVGHLPFAPESKAALSGATSPKGSTTHEDDAVLEAWLLTNTSLSWHPLGLCKMTPCDKMGVVDASLGLYVTKHLKVVDLSIVPGIVSRNPEYSVCHQG